VLIALGVLGARARVGGRRGLGLPSRAETSGRVGADIHNPGVVPGFHIAIPGGCGEEARNDPNMRMVEDYLLCSRFVVRSFRIRSRVEAKAGSREAFSAIRAQAYSTVLWSRLPKRRPISTSVRGVACLVKYMATWRARATELVRRLPRSDSGGNSK
jgi:hypothetical protein